MAFTQWLSKETGMVFRLPTEAEWEKACRGTNGLIFPWANAFDVRKANTIESDIGETTSVGQYSPLGSDSPYGVVDMAGNQAVASGGRFRIRHDMADAFAGAEIIYPKSWAPMQVARQRTELLKRGDRAGLQALEKECLAENARHASWHCDAGMMKRTAAGAALYMHCLPADISGVSCDQGEVSKDVFERFRLETYREASWKPFVIAALILLTRVPDPAAALRRLAGSGTPRVR